MYPPRHGWRRLARRTGLWLFLMLPVTALGAMLTMMMCIDRQQSYIPSQSPHGQPHPDWGMYRAHPHAAP